MSGLNFIDYVKLHLRAGHGGSGSAHLHRARYVSKGGPDGGDGGNGGSIILRADPQLNTLLHLKYRKHVLAPHGAPGAASHQAGANGADVILKVPLGTVVKAIDVETEAATRVAELTQSGQCYIAAQGGKGGKGNAHFKSATNRTPRYAQPGLSGQKGWFILELKLLADVGLIGLPNAGKSTLLSALSAAKPKIAAYPFTTLVPQLGIVAYREGQSFVMADIPGLIAGAAAGRGLGTRFLRHAARNAVLLLLIGADDPDPCATYSTLRRELETYDAALAAKPHVLVISKADLLTPAALQTLQAALAALPQSPAVYLSAHTGQGVVEIKDVLWRLLHHE